MEELSKIVKKSEPDVNGNKKLKKEIIYNDYQNYVKENIK